MEREGVVMNMDMSRSDAVGVGLVLVLASATVGQAAGQTEIDLLHPKNFLVVFEVPRKRDGVPIITVWAIWRGR